MKQTTLRSLRRYHQYIGMFFAPWILLFAVSGALQTFRLNEPRGYGGTAPQWMVWLSSVHKDQAPPRDDAAVAKPKAASPEAGKRHADGDGDAGPKRPNPLPLKIFVVLLSIALAGSTIIGVVIGLANRAMRRTSVVLLLLGMVIPPCLLWV